MEKPKLAIIGGSGFYELPGLSEIEWVKPLTKYGYPSDRIAVGRYHGETVAFLPRHGERHQLPPHRIPYKANIAALKELGVEKIVATCIAGSLKEEISPGSFVVIDQFVNLTWGRDDYFEADGGFVHLPMAQPYCRNLSETIGEFTRQMGIPVRTAGTVVVVQGPRFSTLAESAWFVRNGWDLVNMTQYPECYFSREMGICYAACAAITDYDPGVGKDLQINPSQMEKVLGIFKQNVARLKELSLAIVKSQSTLGDCRCASSLIEEYYHLAG